MVPSAADMSILEFFIFVFSILVFRFLLLAIYKSGLRQKCYVRIGRCFGCVARISLHLIHFLSSVMMGGPLGCLGALLVFDYSNPVADAC